MLENMAKKDLCEVGIRLIGIYYLSFIALQLPMMLPMIIDGFIDKNYKDVGEFVAFAITICFSVLASWMMALKGEKISDYLFSKGSVHFENQNPDPEQNINVDNIYLIKVGLIILGLKCLFWTVYLIPQIYGAISGVMDNFPSHNISYAPYPISMFIIYLAFTVLFLFKNNYFIRIFYKKTYSINSKENIEYIKIFSIGIILIGVYLFIKNIGIVVHTFIVGLDIAKDGYDFYNTTISLFASIPMIIFHGPIARWLLTWKIKKPDDSGDSDPEPEEKRTL